MNEPLKNGVDMLKCIHLCNCSAQAASEMYFILYPEGHQPNIEIFRWYDIFTPNSTFIFTFQLRVYRLEHNLINFGFFDSKRPKKCDIENLL